MRTSKRNGITTVLFDSKRWGLMIAIAALLFIAPTAQAAIISGAGTGDITFHSTFYADGVIAPSHTTGTVGIPASPGALTHEVFAPLGVEHAYMKMSWDFSASDPDVFIPGPTGIPDTTRLELVPAPSPGAHHAATMTGSFEILYTLDAAGLPTVTLPAQTYAIVSYVSPIPLSPAAASFDALWDYTDVGFGPLGPQVIHYDAPIGLGIVSPVASLPLTITVPAGHTTLKVSGFFKLSADSDDFMGGPPPFDTLIAVIPEPGSLVLAVLGTLALGGLAAHRPGRRRRRFR